MSAKIVLVCVILASFAVAGYWHLETKERYTRSAERGLAWLLAYPATYQNEGVFWALHHINATYCQSEELDTYTQERYAKETKTFASEYYESFRTDTTVPSPDINTLTRYDKWLVSSLSCRTEAVSPSIVEDLTNMTYSGYDATHQYIALTYLDRLSCGNALGVELSSLRERVAERIAQEDIMAHHEFSDLSAERSALLLWGGHGKFVSSEWIRTILSNQDLSGGWKDAKTDSRPHPHTTVLAVWSLAQYTHTCPLGALYSTSL